MILPFGVGPKSQIDHKCEPFRFGCSTRIDLVFLNSKAPTLHEFHWILFFRGFQKIQQTFLFPVHVIEKYSITATESDELNIISTTQRDDSLLAKCFTVFGTNFQ